MGTEDSLGRRQRCRHRQVGAWVAPPTSSLGSWLSLLRTLALASRRPGRCPLLRGGLLRARSWVTVPLGSPRGRLHPPRCLISFTIIPLGPPLLLPVETLRVTGSILLTVHLWRAALGFFPELGYCGDYGDAHVFVK